MSLSFLVALALITPSSPTPQQVWRDATEHGFTGGAIVVSGKTTILFEVTNSVASPSLRLTKQIGFPICSVTKAMTAQVVLDLIAERKLSLDGRARQYLSWLPEFTDQITIRQLLTHTSGLRNMDGANGTDADGVGSIYRSYDISLKDLRSRVLKLLGDRAASTPGSKYDYNNTDYILLQAIAEKVARQKFEKLLQSRIFKKALMNTSRLATWNRNDSSYVGCYQTLNGAAVQSSPFNMAIYGGAAGVISSPEDLCSWLKFTLNTPTGQRLLANGSQYRGFQGFGGYAFATSSISKALSSNHEEQVFERPGAVNGFGLQVSFLPERKLSVAVFSNREGEKLGSIYEGKGLAFDLILAALKGQSDKMQ